MLLAHLSTAITPLMSSHCVVTTPMWLMESGVARAFLSERLAHLEDQNEEEIEEKREKVQENEKD